MNRHNYKNRLIKCSRSKEIKGLHTITAYKIKGVFPKFFHFLPLSLKIFWEFYSGFYFLDKYNLAVSFFGSARETLPKKYYKDVEELARFFAKNNFAVITGGANGIMKCGNKGAYNAKGDSVGINIYIPHEQSTNKYLTDTKTFLFFFSRKTILTYASEVYIYFPGGFGTLDELMEILTLIQTEKIPRIPVILYGKEFWQPLTNFFKKELSEKYKTIDEEDNDLYIVLDSLEEVKQYVSELNFIDGDKTFKIYPDL